MSTEKISSILRKEVDSDKLMVPLSCVSKLVWNEDLGKKLKTLRGKTSRPKFIKSLEQHGYKISLQHYQYMEEGRQPSVAVDFVFAVSEVLGISPGQLFPLLKIEEYK